MYKSFVWGRGGGEGHESSVSLGSLSAFQQRAGQDNKWSLVERWNLLVHVG